MPAPALPDRDSSRSGRLHRALRPVKESRFLGYISRALRAAAYPLQGIWYFLRHPAFYPLFLGRLLPLSLISFLVYFILFTFTFLPQYAFLAIFQGWGAWLNAVVLVLGEGLVIIQGLFEGFFVDECRVDVFDATLLYHSLPDLVAPQRLLFPDAAPNAVKMLGKPTSRAEFQPWSLKQIVELIVFLPLNLVPYVGTPAFILITGSRLGKLSHYRWYQLRGLDRKQRKREIKARSWEYLWFGTVAMVLELIPILSFFFLLTTAAGSALWVCKMEQERRTAEAAVQATRDGQTGMGIPAGDRVHETAATEDEAPPPYSDEPPV
ncbi:Protein family CysZ [Pleurostoma richardsiae]|uniref:Protein family CysZ n=1 Tax=Pleurostoma richardsiae TaxID=41990 RepID=A0AA38RJ79_9PEZI|nr:Protein family CysZ [Pleurostoma richardsiae]